MSAMGHKRTFNSIIAQRPLSGVKRPFGPIYICRIFERFGISSAMSPIPESGHSVDMMLNDR